MNAVTNINKENIEILLKNNSHSEVTNSRYVVLHCDEHLLFVKKYIITETIFMNEKLITW